MKSKKYNVPRRVENFGLRPWKELKLVFLEENEFKTRDESKI